MNLKNTAPHPLYTIVDEQGQPSGVILSLSDYQMFLKLLHSHADWGTLPHYLQDAVDNMLADEAEQADNEFVSINAFLTGASKLGD